MTASRPATDRPRFVVLNSALQGRTFALVGPVANLGRSPDCEIQLDLASVSRAHARVEERGGMYIIRDLGSRNGIKIAGQVVREGVLNDGDVVGVGDVELRFEWPAPAAPAATDAAVRPLTRTDLATLAAAAAAAPPPGARPAAEGAAPPLDAPPATIGLNTRLILAIIIGLVLALSAGVLILRLKSRGGVTARQGELAPVLVKAGETRWVPVSGWRQVKIDRKTVYAPLGPFADRIEVGDADIASAEKYGEGDLLVTGKSSGETSLVVQMNSGSLITMRVLVRGRAEDIFDELTYGRFTPEDRKVRAQSFFDSGAQIEAEKPYLAMQEYKKAVAILKPVPEKGELYLRAGQGVNRTSQLVESRWEKLRDDILVAARTNDRPRQLQLLQDAIKLIPDPADPRYQKAQARVQELVREEIQERERGRK